MNQSFKTRLTTGFFYAAAVLFLDMYSKYTALILMAFIVLSTAYEYGRITAKGNIWKKYLCVLLASIPALFFVYFPDDYNLYAILLHVSILFSLFAILNLYFVRDLLQHENWAPLISLLYLGLSGGLMIKYILDQNPYNYSLILGMFVLIWVSDSGAYLIGSRIGKRKLFKRVSPNKTWEGTIGAGIFAVLTSLILAWFFKDFSVYFWIMLGVIAWIFGTYGDLVESSIKRTFGVKDSGNILPGHGGFLDRFDSFIFIIPFVLFLLEIMK